MDGVGLLFKLLMLLGNLPSSKAPAISACIAETWKPFCHLPLGLDDKGWHSGSAALSASCTQISFQICFCL